MKDFLQFKNTDLKFAIFNVSYKEKSTNHTNAI